MRFNPIPIVLFMFPILVFAFWWFSGEELKPRPPQSLDEQIESRLGNKKTQPQLPQQLPRQLAEQINQTVQKRRESIRGLASRKNVLRQMGGKKKNRALLKSDFAVEVGRQKYQILKNVKAVRSKDLAQTQDFKVLDERGGYFFVKALKETAEFPAGALPAAQSTQSGQFAIVTGRLQVRFTANMNVQNLAQDYGLGTDRVFERVRVGFFRAQTQKVEELIELSNQIAQDSRVVRSELEIMGDFPVPK